MSKYINSSSLKIVKNMDSNVKKNTDFQAFKDTFFAFLEKVRVMLLNYLEIIENE